MWNGKSVCVVFPAYNEEPNIRSAIQDFRSVLDSRGAPVVDEIIVVDNNSKDQTANFARESGANVITEKKQGYGNALKRGLSDANKEIIVLCEPDATFVAKDIFKLLAYSEDFQMVCGTRTTVELIWKEANMGWSMRAGNVIVAKFMQLLYGTCSLSDCGCTFRLIHRKAAQQMLNDLHVGQSHFLPNMVIAARRHAITMIEIPLTYRGRVGESKITGNLKGTVKTALNMIRLMILSWPSYLMRPNKN